MTLLTWVLLRIGFIKKRLKFKDGKQFKGISQILDILDQSREPEEFLEHTKLEMYSDQVFVFSPNGDLISLPKGAMPIRFCVCRSYRYWS